VEVRVERLEARWCGVDRRCGERRVGGRRDAMEPRLVAAFGAAEYEYEHEYEYEYDGDAGDGAVAAVQ
jgi:hypothetical protein